MLDYHRRRFRLQPVRPACPGHPLDRLWQRRKAELDELRRREEERAAAERLAAERAAQAERAYGVLLSVLRHEGLSLLQGRPLPVPHPDLYRVPAPDWQARLLGFVHRAGVAFTIGAAAGWLRYRGYVRSQSPQAELENMRAFWRLLADAGLVAYESDHRIVPLKRHAWPVTGPVPAGAPALCIMCATVHPEPDLTLTEQWQVCDPAYGLCKCLDCPAE